LMGLYLPAADEGIRIDYTQTPREAIVLLAQGGYECIVSDYAMPEMDGIRLCSQVRTFSEIPFILYTARGSEEVAEEAFRVGVDDYVRKDESTSHYVLLARRIRHAVEKKRSENLYKAGIEENRDGFAIIQDNVFKYANPAMAEILGVDYPHDLVNRSILSWLVEVDRESFSERRRGRRGDYPPGVYQYSISRSDGSVRRLEAFFSPISYMGRPASLVFNRDVTEWSALQDTLRASEEKYRALVAPSMVGILTADEERIVDGNDAFLKLVGYTRTDLKRKRLFWRRMTPPEYATIDNVALSDILEKGICVPYEKEYIRKDGSRIPVLISGSIIRRNPFLCVYTVLDLAEKKGAEAELREAYDKIRAASRELEAANEKLHRLERGPQPDERIT